MSKDYFPMARGALRTTEAIKQRFINYVALPTASKFHLDAAIHRFVMGPFGSGKTVMMFQELVREAELQRVFLNKRTSRFAIIRNTYPQLKSTSIKTFQQWLPEVECPITFGSPILGTYRHNMADGTLLDIEFVFVALDKPKHVANLLSMELSGAMVNEFREVPKAIIDAVGGRIGRWPAKKDGGWRRKFVIGDSNPPDDDHWIHNSFEDPDHDLYVGDNPDWKLWKQPPAIVKGFEGWEPNKGQIDGIACAENAENLEDGYQYWMDMIPNKTTQWIKVYLEGKYGTISDGLPVYGDHWGGAFHTSEYALVPIKNRDLYLGWDFGLTPACIVGQMMPSGQLRILEEFCATSMGLRNFAENVVRPVISTKYSGLKILSEGDPSGAARDYEEHDAFQILNDVFKAEKGGFFTNPSSTNNLQPRLESVRFFLSRTIGAGQPAFLVDPRCKMIIRGFEGHYRFRMMQIVGETKYYATPDKNAYSHPHDGLQALCLMVSPGVDQREPLPPMGLAHARPLDVRTNF